MEKQIASILKYLLYLENSLNVPPVPGALPEQMGICGVMIPCDVDIMSTKYRYEVHGP